MNKIKFVASFILLTIFNLNLLRAQTTYNDVATIFYDHCSYCHHSGGGAPMSLMTFYETNAWTAEISNAIQGKNGKIMPPWHADTAFTMSGKMGARFIDENVLTLEKKNAILQWIADGALEGDTDSLPEAPKYGDVSQKLNGIADLTIEAPLFKSNSSASKEDAFNCFTVPSNLTEDRWLRAYEIIPGNSDIQHHIFVNVDTTASISTDTSGNCNIPGGQILLGTWIAGSSPTIFPNDSAFKVGLRIPKGSNFIFNIHYRPGTQGLVDDHTKIRLFFYPTNDTKNMRPVHTDVFLQQWDIAAQFLNNPSIPKNQTVTWTGLSSNFSPTGHDPEPNTAMTVLAVNAHSHYICSDIKIYAASGGDSIPILKINDWDVNWQRNYWFPQPLKVPDGYTLKSEHIYNNITSNPHLLGPPVDTYFGEASVKNEMLYDAFIWLDYMPGDENIDMKSLIEKDTLLRVGIVENNQLSFPLTVYPNPSSESISIQVPVSSKYKAQILTLSGQIVLTSNVFNNRTILDIKKLPRSIYLLIVNDLVNNTSTSQTISIVN